MTKRETIAARIAIGVLVAVLGSVVTATWAAAWDTHARMVRLETTLDQRARHVDELLGLHHQRLVDLERRAK